MDFESWGEPKVAFNKTFFRIESEVRDVSFVLESPLKLDDDHDSLEFQISFFRRQNLKENSIHQVYLSGPAGKRIGWLIPVNALSSSEHDQAENKFFLKYAYSAHKAIAQSLTPEQLAAALAHNGASITLAELFESDIAVLVLSVDNLANLSDFSVSRIVPSLVAYGYVPASVSEGGAVAVLAAPVEIEGRLKVSLISSDIENPELIERLITLAAASGTSRISQFFFLYQIIEYLMDAVLRHRLPAVARAMIGGVKAGQTGSLREDIEALQDQFREKKRIELLVSHYCSTPPSVAKLGRASQNFLEAVGPLEKQGVEALYAVRNFVFHQTRNIPESQIDLLDDVVEEFIAFIVDLVTSYRLPSDGGAAAVIDALNNDYRELAAGVTV